MDYRKLISFGKSSFVVSIPKEWMSTNNLQKGDTVTLNIRNQNLIIQPKDSHEIKNESEIVISVDDKSLKYLDKEIISAYINNYRKIVLEGSQIKTKSRDIQKLIHNLIALEVMEQKSNVIVAQDFLNMKDLSIHNLIKKMDIAARSLLADARRSFEENNYENISQRDEDINRLFFLICRAIKYGLRNPLMAPATFGVAGCEDLLNLRLAATYIEKISDTAKRAARYMGLVKFSEKQKKEFIKILGKIDQQFVEMMEAYYKKDVEKALKICDTKEEMMELCHAFYLKNKKCDWIGYLTNNLKTMVTRIHSMGRVIYQ